MLLPSGDHRPPEASVEMLVTLRGSPVSVPLAESKSCTQICEPPSRDDSNRTRLPSGEKRMRSSPAPAGGSEPARLAAADGNDPQMRLARVLVEVDVHRAEADPLAVGRDDGLADALELHHVFEGEGTLALREAATASSRRE